MKLSRKIISLLTALAIIIGVLPLYSMQVVAVDTTEEFAGGTGSTYNPYIIETKEQLNNIRNYPSSSFKLNTDLVFTAADFSKNGLFYNNGKGFEPIGTYEEPFTGTFDGNNHYIKGLYINIETTTKKLAVGLFGYTTGTIMNLGVADGLIRVKTSASMAYVTAGGVAGDSKKGVDRCYNSCSIEAIATGPWSVSLAGGVVGTTDGTITNCYNAGKVYSESYKSSSGESYAGGIVAKISGSVSETVIQSCLNIGDVSCEGTTTYRGAIAGYSYQGKAMWCYYELYSMSPFGNSGAQSSYVHGLTDEQMATERSFDGLTDGWKLTTTFGHPTLTGLEHIKTWNYSEFAGGAGTQDEPYLIITKEHFKNVNNYLAAHYKLIADIDFEDDDFSESGIFYNEGQGWIPIGTSSNYFSGTFNGDGHTISGLSIDVESTSAFLMGIFGYSKGIITNLNVRNSFYTATVTGSNGGRCYAGGIVAYQSGGSISNCSSNVVMFIASTGEYLYPYVGGICAYAYNNSTIENCSNKGDIVLYCTGTSYTGGIAGYAYHATVSNCINEADIDGGRNTAGIAGYSSYSSTITKCANTGLVEGIYCTGGICGYSSESAISYSYNTGHIISKSTVTASSSYAYAYAGGISGESSRGTVSNCYNTGKIEARTAYINRAKAGGLLGRTSAAVSYCYNVGVVCSDSEAMGICASTDSMNGGSFTKCYYLNTCGAGVAGTVADTAVSCTNDQVLVASTYAGFNFTSIWEMGNTDAHPFPQLISNKHISSASDDEQPAEFSGGSGTVSDPYKVATKEQLDSVRKYASNGLWFVLTEDITFEKSDFSEGGTFYNNGQGWIPIGSKDSPFTGGFDGNKHSITGLYSNIIGTGDLYVGLFGYCEGAILDLNIVDADITGTITGSENSVWVGGVCGYLASGSIEGCSASGAISAYETCAESQDKSKAYAGGIAGQSNTGSFVLCVNSAHVTAQAASRDSSSGGGSYGTFADAGGIVAKTAGAISKCYNIGRIDGQATGIHAQANAAGITTNSSKNISMCYNTGTIRALGNPNNGAAGIVGFYSTGTISNCYNTGYITADGNVGGIVEYLSSGTVSNVYNVGEISGYSSYYVRAIIADAYSGTVKNCYYTNTKISGIGRMTDTSVRLTLDDAQQQASYNGFDFNSVWKMCELSDHPYPELRELNHTTIPQPENTTEFFGGTGSYFNPFKIANKEHLNNVRKYPSAYFIMVEDIEFVMSDFEENGSYYNGGAGWEPIGTSSLAFAGTFDGNGHVIKGLYVNIVVDRGDIYAGLFGISKGTIKNLGIANSQISARVIGTNTNYVCIAHAGGIVGENYGLIENCYNTGNVLAFCETSQVSAGGIAGEGGSYRNCFNTGNVKAHSNGTSHFGSAGGITSSGSTIENCYNTGLVEAIAAHPTAGGIAVYGSNVVSCYYLDNIDKGIGSGTDSTIRCSFEEMSSQNTFEGFDFANIWTIVSDGEYLYPQLKGIPTFFEKDIINIFVSELPNRVAYLESKDKFVLSGGKIMVGYTGGTTSEQAMTVDMLDSIVSDETETSVVSIKYNNVSSNFRIFVFDYLIGDVNGDDELDNLDRLTLTRYLANWDDYGEDAINIDASDVNQDGSVDNLDRLVLTRHLANWEGYDDLPCAG